MLLFLLECCWSVVVVGVLLECCCCWSVVGVLFLLECCWSVVVVVGVLLECCCCCWSVEMLKCWNFVDIFSNAVFMSQVYFSGLSDVLWSGCWSSV